MSRLTKYAVDYTKIKLHPFFESISINFIAAIFTATITNPIWVLNVRMAKKERDVRFYDEYFRKKIWEILI